MQVIGVGSQDDFAYTQNFIEKTGASTPTLLWDPNFTTWAQFGITVNSQMMMMSGDLTRATDLFFGFDDEVQAQVLELASELS